MHDTEAGECPFCGSPQSDLIEIEHGHWIVECDKCGAIGPGGAERGDAMAAWNRRAKFAAARTPS